MEFDYTATEVARNLRYHPHGKDCAMLLLLCLLAAGLAAWAIVSVVALLVA